MKIFCLINTDDQEKIDKISRGLEKEIITLPMDDALLKIFIVEDSGKTTKLI